MRTNSTLFKERQQNPMLNNITSQITSKQTETLGPAKTKKLVLYTLYCMYVIAQ